MKSFRRSQRSQMYEKGIVMCRFEFENIKNVGVLRKCKLVEYPDVTGEREYGNS